VLLSAAGGEMAKKILVIDDEELIIKSLVKLLTKSGFDVFIAKNGQDALAMIECEELFDLLLVDIRMPGMDGVETVRAINDNLKEKECKRIPVIFITGYANADIRKEAEILKPIAYIHKPFDILELVNKIKGVLQ